MELVFAKRKEFATTKKTATIKPMLRDMEYRRQQTSSRRQTAAPLSSTQSTHIYIYIC